MDKAGQKEKFEDFEFFALVGVSTICGLTARAIFRGHSLGAVAGGVQTRGDQALRYTISHRTIQGSP